MNGVYVALGSSMAAGPGIKPRVPGSPRRAGRSTRAYANLVAEALEIDLIDVTYSGATLVTAAAASRDHHAWSAQPWTVGAGIPWPGRPVPMHPNAAGMRAVADLIVDAVRPGR